MGINNPIPRSLRSESNESYVPKTNCSRKAAKVLASFIKPNQVAGPDQVIPPEILRNAKGLAIITVLKAGFLFSGRAGSGVIVARLPDGSWSPPSAIITAGAGVGGQIGAELTDFVFILNTRSAVESFAQLGSITLGTNVSVAAGPLGRNAEAAGTASLKSVSAVFAYSKTKGLFAGVSLEGSAIIERRETNRKFYGSNCKARNILAGQVEAPSGCEPLMRLLESRVFSNKISDEDFYNDDYYDDIPDDFSESTSQYSRGNKVRYQGSRRHSDEYGYSDDEYSDDDSRHRRTGISTRSSVGTNSRRSAWEDNVYDGGSSRRRGNSDVDNIGSKLSGTKLGDTTSSPSRPSTNSKPNFGGGSKSSANQAIALYSFKGEQPGDLPFRKGDVIDILKKSETTDDWWTGRNNGVSGIFPANYVELI
ncbi:hypothetical protein JCM33374_g5428 [Metschnikowia sp. JCM 33374]|nr:hypothetical protein JCM33374_g5428 [Metschnikowia sp. JCM 33374]